MVNINCLYNDRVIWCKNKKVKRKFPLLGKRLCLKVEGKDCPYACSYPVKNKIADIEQATAIADILETIQYVLVDEGAVKRSENLKTGEVSYLYQGLLIEFNYFATNFKGFYVNGRRARFIDLLYYISKSVVFV